MKFLFDWFRALWSASASRPPRCKTCGRRVLYPCNTSGSFYSYGPYDDNCSDYF